MKRDKIIFVLFCILFIVVIFLLIEGSLLFPKFIIYKNQYYEIKVPFDFREEYGHLSNNFPNQRASYVYGYYINLSCMAFYDCADNFKEGILIDVVVNDIEGLNMKDFVRKYTGQNFPDPVRYEDGSGGAEYKLIPFRKNRREGFVQILYSNNKESGRRYYFSNEKYFYYIDISLRVSRKDYERRKFIDYEDFIKKYKNTIEDIINSFQPIKD